LENKNSKWLLLILGAIFFSVGVFATQAPYTYEEDKRFRALENGTAENLPSGQIYIGNGSGKASAQFISGDATLSNTGIITLTPGNSDGTQVQRISRFTYNIALSGGSVGTINLDAGLPANAAIIRSYIYMVTQETSPTSSATMAIACGGASVLSTANKTSVASGTFIDGDSTSSVSLFKKVGSAACTFQLTIGTENLTAGKFVGFTEYVLLQ
jgi:hypothetical protein